MARKKLLDPIHPGEILLDDFMKPMGLSINEYFRAAGESQQESK